MADISSPNQTAENAEKAVLLAYEEKKLAESSLCLVVTPEESTRRLSLKGFTPTDHANRTVRLPFVHSALKPV